MKSDSNIKKIVGLALSVLFILLAAVLPVNGELTRVGWYSLGVFLAAIALWICDSIPMMISALVCMFLLPVFGVMDLNAVYANFGGVSFFFAIATFGLSIALENTTIPLRICSALARWAKGSSRKLIIGLYLACSITSSVMSNLSTAIIYLNISLALLHANNQKPLTSNMGKCLMIGIPAVAGTGGLITPAGTPGNSLIIQMLSGVGVEVTFLKWTLMFAPIALFTTLLCGLWATRIWKPEDISAEALASIQEKIIEQDGGFLTSKEKKTVVIILATLVAWVLGTWVPALDVTRVSIAALAVMFLPGVDVLSLEDMCKRTSWNLVFTLGTVGVLIAGLTGTGIMDWLVNILFSRLGNGNVILIMLVAGAVVCVIRAFIPTAPAIAALFGAPLLALAPLCGISPVALLFLPAFWACTPTLLYIEPIFLFSYGYGYYKPEDVLKYGSIPTVILIVLMAFTAQYVGLFGF